MNRPVRKNRYKKNYGKSYITVKWMVKILISSFLIAVIIGFQSFLFIFGYQMFTNSKFLKAQKIEIKGNHFLAESQILEIAGIALGTNLFSVNLSLIKKRLMTNPWVEDVRVRREIPDKFYIQLKEHEPLAIIDSGKKYLMNKKGQVFKTLDENNLKELPVIYGLKPVDINTEKNTSKESVKGIIDFLEIMNRENTVLSKLKIDRIIMDEEMGLSIQLTDNLKMIRLGYENYEAKLDRLEQVLILLGHQRDIKDFKIIDINNPNRIVVLPVKTKNPGGKGKEV